ncbi:MAG: hypothetical protein GWO24_35160 [Akkermansiaceae bacterium]|nr:hypothetical protein [Akkermansiaceae bacterium]
MNDDEKIELPEWTRLAAFGVGLVAASAPWTQGWSETGAKVWFSITVFFLVVTMWSMLWVLVGWANDREKLRRYNLDGDDE